LGYLRCILRLFEAMSGLRVNLSKSALIPVGDLPLGAPYKSIAIWDPVIERFHKRLARWKSKLLSRGGRLTLLRSTLCSLPIYFMSLFTIPASIANRLEIIMRDFL